MSVRSVGGLTESFSEFLKMKMSEEKEMEGARSDVYDQLILQCVRRGLNSQPTLEFHTAVLPSLVS